MDLYNTLLQNQFLFEFSPHLVATAAVIATSVLMFVAVRSVRKVWLAATLPIALVIVATLFFSIHNISGQPTERAFVGEFRYLAYYIDDSREWIYVWGKEGAIAHPVAHKTRYTEELHQKLSDAAKAQENGEEIGGMMGGNGEDDNGGEMAFHKFKLELDRDDPLKVVPENPELPSTTQNQ